MLVSNLGLNTSGGKKYRKILVPKLRLGTPMAEALLLLLVRDAELPAGRSQAELGNEVPAGRSQAELGNEVWERGYVSDSE